MLPYGRQTISEDDIEAVATILRGDWLTTGPAVEEFERKISEHTGHHSTVSCTSGTAALHIAYAAAGVGLGDEVVCTPMTFIASASAATMLGARVVFADVDPGSALIDPASVAAAVGPRTKILTAVDYAGQPADYGALQPIAHAADALVLADAAHSIGGSAGGRPVGDLADITTLSFFPTKNVTTGEGGAVLFKDPALARRAREFRTVGLVRDPERFRIRDQGPWHQEVQEFGLNYRLTDIGCALGMSQLARLEDFKVRRAALVELYDQLLGDTDGLELLARRQDVDPMWHLYPVRVMAGRRREVFERMRTAGIGVQVNYLPVYWHPAYQDLGYRRGLCPNAEQFYEEELSLPLFPGLSAQDVERVAEALRDALT